MRSLRGEAVYNGETVTLFEIWGDDVTIIRYEHGPLTVKLRELSHISSSCLLDLAEED